MSADLETLKSRRNRMVAINAAAAVLSVAGLVGFLQFGLAWAGALFVAALLTGFGAQIWFILGLRGPKQSDMASAPASRAGRGV